MTGIGTGFANGRGVCAKAASEFWRGIAAERPLLGIGVEIELLRQCKWLAIRIMMRGRLFHSNAERKSVGLTGDLENFY